MLVIKLKVGERCKIGDEIEILISDCENGRADVGIKAPKDRYPVSRLPSKAKEIYGARNEDFSQPRSGD